MVYQFFKVSGTQTIGLSLAIEIEIKIEVAAGLRSLIGNLIYKLRIRIE